MVAKQTPGPPQSPRDEVLSNPSVLLFGGMETRLEPDSRVLRLETGATGVTKATIEGLWHLSTKKIDQFRDGEGTGFVSKLGPGTYIGQGYNTGTQVNLLRSGPHVEHKLVLNGNILFVPSEEQFNAAYELAELTIGDSNLDLIANLSPGHIFNKLLREYPLDGMRYDAFIFYWDHSDPTFQGAEGVVLNPANSLHVVDQIAH